MVGRRGEAPLVPPDILRTFILDSAVDLPQSESPSPASLGIIRPVIGAVSFLEAVGRA